MHSENPLRIDGYAPIGAYAAIGDGRTAALVALDGSIDWLCAPRVDSPSVFAALVDADRGGCFLLRPEGAHRATRRYAERTNVLETTFESDGGTVVVTDALTLDGGRPPAWRELVRKVECTAGEARLSWTVEPRFGYGLEETSFQRRHGVVAACSGERAAIVLSHGAGDVDYSATTARGSFTLAEGESAVLALVLVDGAPWPAPGRDELERRLEETLAFWSDRWERIEYDGEWDAPVRRSVLALELLADAETGAMVAAPTMALPERIGGSRNFDYRYVWVRDAGFALDALLDVGLLPVSHRALDWLLRATEHTHPRLQPLFDLHGSPDLPDDELPLHGYRGSQPVTLGNSAARQLQLGNFGDLLLAAWRYACRGNAIDPGTGRRLAEVADLVCEIWENDDAGIWELGQHRQYTSSKMSSWSCLEHALRLAELGLVPPGHADRWRSERKRIRAFVEERCWSEERRAYAFHAGSTDLDASVLLGRRLGFLDAEDERFRSTLDAILDELADGALVWRYSGMRGEEGAFLACSFWVVDALAAAGRVDEAAERMRDLVELANDVGLYSEEAGADGELLGNFPQALTHLSLILAARSLDAASAKQKRGASRVSA
ncbi:MAG TPA: glycoside hydrolase family 15 protein [Gaiellaceae bacterium]|nr:glycoside hydrolase family 15 protein [Gaiellaceae bacterium]